jgi:hypothetical protein
MQIGIVILASSPRLAQSPDPTQGVAVLGVPQNYHSQRHLNVTPWADPST